MRIKEYLYQELKPENTLPDFDLNRTDVLYHGFTNHSLEEWNNKRCKYITNEFNFDKPEIGLYLTNNFNEAFLHGSYVIQIEFKYSYHLELVEVCRLNKLGLINDNYPYFDKLDENSPECFHYGLVNFDEVVRFYDFDINSWYDNKKVLKSIGVIGS